MKASEIAKKLNDLITKSKGDPEVVIRSGGQVLELKQVSLRSTQDDPNADPGAPVFDRVEFDG